MPTNHRAQGYYDAQNDTPYEMNPYPMGTSEAGYWAYGHVEYADLQRWGSACERVLSLGSGDKTNPNVLAVAYLLTQEQERSGDDAE